MLHPTRTPTGKWVIYDADTGHRLERWPVDAKAMLKTDAFVADPPDGAQKQPEKAPEPPEDASPPPEGVKGGTKPVRFPRDRRTDDDGYPVGYTHEQSGAYVTITAPDGEPVESDTPSGKWLGNDAAKQAAWRHWEAQAGPPTGE